MGHLQQMVFLNTFSKVYAAKVSTYQASRDAEMEALVENTNFNDIVAIQRALDTAENINAFIQYNFKGNNLTNTLGIIYHN